MYPMMSPYGPGMADNFGQDAYGTGRPMMGLLPRFQMGGGLPPMYQPPPQTGGPLQPQQNGGIVPPNVLTGGGLRPALHMQVHTGGGQMPQQMPQNRLGGFVGGNYGMGGLLR